MAQAREEEECRCGGWCRCRVFSWGGGSRDFLHEAGVGNRNLLSRPDSSRYRSPCARLFARTPIHPPSHPPIWNTKRSDCARRFPLCSYSCSLPWQIFTTEGFLHLTIPQSLMASGVANPEALSGGGRTAKGHRGAEHVATAFADPRPPGGGTPPKVWTWWCILLCVCVFFFCRGVFDRRDKPRYFLCLVGLSRRFRVVVDRAVYGVAVLSRRAWARADL